MQRGRTALCNVQSRHSQAQSHAGARSIFGSPDPWRVDGSIAAPKYAMGARVVDLRCRCSFCLLPGLIISITRCEAAVPADEMSSANRRSAKRLYQATGGRDGASPRSGLLCPQRFAAYPKPCSWHMLVGLLLCYAVASMLTICSCGRSSRFQQT